MLPTRAAPLVRLAPELTCPACDRFAHAVQLRDGEAWITCAKCTATWLDLAVPRDTVPDLTLARRYGRPLADALATICEELLCTPRRPSLARVDDAPLEPVLHVQLLGTRRLAHLHRYAAVPDVWRAIQRTAERTQAASAKAG